MVEAVCLFCFESPCRKIYLNFFQSCFISLRTKLPLLLISLHIVITNCICLLNDHELYKNTNIYYNGSQLNKTLQQNILKFC